MSGVRGWGVSVALLVSLVGFAITMTVLSSRIARERDDALTAKKEAEDNLRRATEAVTCLYFR